MDDSDAFRHLASLGITAPECDSFVKQCISSQFDGEPSPGRELSEHRTRLTENTDLSPETSKSNLYGDYGDLFPDSDRVLSLLVALGGSNIPLDLLKSVREPQRRWGADGETAPVSTTEFHLSEDMVEILRDDESLARVSCLPSIQQDVLDDGTIVWSIHPEFLRSLESGLSPSTKETWESMALGLICYACPPCYEGKVNWWVSV